MVRFLMALPFRVTLKEDVKYVAVRSLREISKINDDVKLGEAKLKLMQSWRK